MDYYFIVNPVSGRGKGKIIGEHIIDHLNRLSIDFEVEWTERPGHAIELAEQGVKNHTVIVAVGGDGTMNEVLNGMAGGNNVLGLIPVGSGNDFARAVGIPFDFKQALEVLLRGRKKQIDLGKANERFFGNGVGIGFDAYVVHNSLKVRRLRGNAIYLYSVLRTLKEYKPVPLEIHFNGSTKIDDFFMISVGNGVSMGGGFYLTPDAQMDDGLFDLCLIQNMPMVSILKNLLKVYSGKHKEDPRVEMQRTDRLQIESRKPFGVHIDGELLSLKMKKLEIEIIPRGLEVIC